jgi:hypothetical protein
MPPVGLGLFQVVNVSPHERLLATSLSTEECCRRLHGATRSNASREALCDDPAYPKSPVLNRLTEAEFVLSWPRRGGRGMPMVVPAVAGTFKTDHGHTRVHVMFGVEPAEVLLVLGLVGSAALSLLTSAGPNGRVPGILILVAFLVLYVMARWACSAANLTMLAFLVETLEGEDVTATESPEMLT